MSLFVIGSTMSGKNEAAERRRWRENRRRRRRRCRRFAAAGLKTQSGCAQCLELRSKPNKDFEQCRRLLTSRACHSITATNLLEMHNSPFTVAGMSSSTSSHHSPNLNAWGSSSTGGPLASSFGDSLSQSRSHYQSGYLMVRNSFDTREGI